MLVLLLLDLIDSHPETPLDRLALNLPHKVNILKVFLAKAIALRQQLVDVRDLETGRLVFFRALATQCVNFFP